MFGRHLTPEIPSLYAQFKGEMGELEELRELKDDIERREKAQALIVENQAKRLEQVRLLATCSLSPTSAIGQNYQHVKIVLRCHTAAKTVCAPAFALLLLHRSGDFCSLTSHPGPACVCRWRRCTGKRR